MAVDEAGRRRRKERKKEKDLIERQENRKVCF